jgi:Leucine-rich repeat (LRR) protein
MQHHVFGPIEWNADMGRWAGRVRLGFFAAYDTVAASACAERLGIPNRPTTPDPGHAKGEFELYLIGPARGTPSASQERAFLDLLDRQDTVCDRVVDAIFDHYRCTWGDWRSEVEPGREEFDSDDLLIPELADRDGLKSLIRLDALSVLDFPGNRQGVLGFCFDCTWDPEHGLGVLVHRGRILELGENDITWRDPESPGQRRPPGAATPQQIALQRGIAAVKRLGGRVTREPDEAGETSVQVDLVRNKQLDDADLNALNHFSSLHQLKLASGQVTDAGLEVLRTLESLRWLQLSGARITDAGLERLHGLRHLKVLYLDGTKISDAGLKELRGLPALTGLRLNETDVTDAGLKEIGAITGLKHLELSGTRVTDAGVRELNDLRGLLTLDLEATRVTDAGLATLKEYRTLRYLNLSRCHVTDLGLEPLKGLKTLRSLKLVATATTDAGVAGLRQVLTGLQVIR